MIPAAYETDGRQHPGRPRPCPTCGEALSGEVEHTPEDCDKATARFEAQCFDPWALAGGMPAPVNTPTKRSP